jgi:NAD(P)-dependent dehydrogenase (short-subunit alcohol dehydrogenase family)
VNNAGVGLLGPLETLSLADVDRVLAVNVRGVFLTSQAAAARMPEGGRIITIGSCMAQRVPGPGGTLYATSKAALAGMTKALARELGERGITANLVHPGPIDTDMNPADGPYAAGQAAMTALGRFGTADEVASMVAYLAGATYVTGAEFAVDGGHAA